MIMKAALKAKITKVDKVDGNTYLQLEAVGKMETPNRVLSHETSFSGSLKLKSVIADQMKIGAIITISISDEDIESV